MLFRSITVRNFRKLVSPVVIEGLGDGVTIIAGDNEEGKSTLLDAIRTGLFERHNLGGKAAEDMLPFGSNVRPEVQLDIEIDRKTYAITKGFVQKPSARLVTPDGIFEGPAAEERLAELLRFKVAQRGQSKPDEQGILGLFWLEQGRALEGLGFGETGRSTLRTSLEEEVGDILGGARGRKLLEEARKKRDALLTATGRPTGQLKEAISAADEASLRVSGLETKRLEYDRDVDELARLRRELSRIESDRVLENAQDGLASVEKLVKAIEGLRLEDKEAGQATALARAGLENVSERWKRRMALIDALASKQAGLTAERADLAQWEAETESIFARLEAASAANVAAARTRSDAEARLSLTLTRTRLEELDKKIADFDRRLAEVSKLTAQWAAARERLSGINIDKRALDRIQTLESERREARAALGAIATRVLFLPSVNQAVSKDGEMLSAGKEIEVTEATRFLLEGFGAVEIAPGATDLVDRSTRLKDLEARLCKTLESAGVENVAQASAHFARRTEAEAHMDEAARLIQAYAPEGIEALRLAHVEKTSERDQLGEGFDLRAAAGFADPETETRSLASAKTAEETAKAAYDAAQKLQQDHKTRLAVAKQRVAGAEEAASEAKRHLEAARAEMGDAELIAALETARENLAAKERRKMITESQLADANPDETELRRKRAEETLKVVTAEQKQLREKAIATESKLTALGQGGIGELLDEARGGLAQAVKRRDRLQADADAWKILVATLESAEREAKEAFLEPVLKRVDPFLRLVLPDARISLDEETLEITGLAREGREEPFEKLSGGMREQLSILVRLAFAVYLREKGYPAAVILDDALVYADDGRFERMKLALRKAAETVQILILTCRARDWRDFGAPVRRLADAKAVSG